MLCLVALLAVFVILLPGSVRATAPYAPATAGAAPGNPATATALALARSAWYQAVALCEAPSLEYSSSGPCVNALAQFYEEAMNGISSPDPNWQPIALPGSGNSVGEGPCQLPGKRAHRSCHAVTSTLAGIASATNRADAIGRALVVSTGRQQGALQFGTSAVAAVQVVAITVDGGEQAPALAQEQQRTLALATTLQNAGVNLTVTEQREANLLNAVRTLSGPAAPAAHYVEGFGFPKAQMLEGAALGLRGITARASGVLSLLRTPFPSTAPMTGAYNALAAPQFEILLLQMAKTYVLEPGPAAAITKAFDEAEGAPNPTEARTAIRHMITVANHTGGAAGQFLAAAAVPFESTFQPLPAPVATINSPAGGGTYALNANVPTSFSCSGDVVSCTDSAGVTGGTGTLYTTTAGPQTYTVTAVGPVGNKAATSISYTVQRGVTKLTTPGLAVLTGSTAEATLTLAGTGAPVIAEYITFTNGKTFLCTTITDAGGTAACNYPSSDAVAVAATGYTATFAGDANYAPSSATAG